MSDPLPKRRIRAQGSPRDPAVMRFILDAAVQEGPARTFEAPEEGAPLSTALFAVEGVRTIQVNGESVIVGLAAGHRWDAMKAPVAAAIRQALASSERPLGDPPVLSSAEQDAKMLASVNHVLDTQANPSIARHGGRVTAERAEGGIIYLRMSGGCQGCAASSLTLRGGVERILRAAIPGIREIVDVTDHSAGANPFYRELRGSSHEATPLQVPAGGEQAEGQGAPTGVAAAAEMSTAKLAEHIRHHLEALPREEVPITYGELARALDLVRPGSIRLVTDALELTMHQDAEVGRPFMAARVASRGSGDLPGRGFFGLAAALGRGPHSSQTAAEFHRHELAATFDPAARAGRSEANSA